MDNNNSTVVVLSATDNWAFAIGTVLLGIKEKTTNHNFDIVIFHQNMSYKNKGILNKILPCRFINFDESKIESERFEKITKIAFSKYECFGLLEEYDKVIYFDADMVIKGNLDELFTMKIDKDTAMYSRKLSLQNDFGKFDLDNIYDMNVDSFNVGLMIINKSIKNPLKIKKWCYEMTNKYANQIHVIKVL